MAVGHRTLEDNCLDQNHWNVIMKRSQRVNGGGKAIAVDLELNTERKKDIGESGDFDSHRVLLYSWLEILNVQTVNCTMNDIRTRTHLTTDACTECAAGHA